jgi:hypothetical protein
MSDKPKRKGIPKPQKPPFQPLRPEQTTIGRVGMAHERFVGRVVTEWAKLEALLNDLIWTMTGLKIEDGRLLTERQDASRLIAILRGLSERYLIDEGTPSPRSRFLDALDIIDQLREDRNLIIHGAWGEVDGIPILLSLRAKPDAPANIAGETYPPSRMVKIAVDIGRCIKIMNAFLGIFESSRKKTSAEPKRDSPGPLPDQ